MVQTTCCLMNLETGDMNDVVNTIRFMTAFRDEFNFHTRQKRFDVALLAVLNTASSTAADGSS